MLNSPMNHKLILLFVVLISGCSKRDPIPVKDADLIDRYHKNKQSMSELLDLKKKTALTKAELERKAVLMKVLGIVAFDSAGSYGLEHQFTILKSGGSIVGGIDKGYSYRETKPGNVADNLDTLKGIKVLKLYHRHIEGNWYIFLLYDD